MDSEKGTNQELERQSDGRDSSTENLEKATVYHDGLVAKDHALGDVESGISDGISTEHREYLIARHGTADLVPLPTMDPADPLNWPSWKVCCMPNVLLMKNTKV